MAENELAHSRAMQDRALDADVRDAREGRWLGLIALIVLIAAALACVLTGHDAIAAAFLGTGVLGIVTQFIKGRGRRIEFDK